MNRFIHRSWGESFANIFLDLSINISHFECDQSSLLTGHNLIFDLVVGRFFDGHGFGLAWCEANGYTLVGLHVDAARSGGRADNRPALQAALSEACKQKAVLIVYSLSRLARSTRDTLLISDRLTKAGADLVSLSEKLDTTSAAGKMLFRLLAVMSEFEKDIIAERTTCAMAHLRSLGQRISGRLPYGYDLASDGETLVPNAREQAGLRVIRALRHTGHGRRRIAAALSTQGIATKMGAAWSPQAVGAILKRELKTGRVVVDAVA